MIRSKNEYKHYLEADRLNLNCRKSLKNYFFNEIWKYQCLLRRAEYYQNCKNSIFSKIILIITKIRLRNLGIQLGITIPLNTFGPGLSIAHRGTIVVRSNVRVGKNCRIHVCVNIGASGGKKEAPVIGNNVYIGPGAKIFGDITIADNIAIGANAAVNKSFTQPDISIGGVPAIKISDGGSCKAGWLPKQKDN